MASFSNLFFYSAKRRRLLSEADFFPLLTTNPSIVVFVLERIFGLKWRDEVRETKDDMFGF
jgi:hypothetical protein